jgi:hypothetical protein
VVELLAGAGALHLDRDIDLGLSPARGARISFRPAQEREKSTDRGRRLAPERRASPHLY